MKFLSKYIDPKSNCQLVFLYACKLLKIQVEYSDLQNQIIEHEDFPSLISISDILLRYGFNSIATKASYSLFSELPTPFIACVQQVKEKDDIVLSIVEKINKDSLDWYDPYNNKSCSISRAKFIEKYKGYIMVFVKVNDDYLNNRITFIKKEIAPTSSYS